MASGGCWGAPESISTAWGWAASAALVYCRGEIFSIPREVSQVTVSDEACPPKAQRPTRSGEKRVQ